MVLTNKQEQGLKIAIDRYNHNEKYTCIAGYAGTGKSTLVQFIISALNLHPEQVAYIAYTGKASLVLQSKGCPNAQTAHRLLYQSYPRNDGTFYHKPRRPIPAYRLIVVDEISMLPKEMWELLLSHDIHVIALGDPGQLPPIGEPNGVLDKPHIFLDEIMRQAQESEIIRLTMDIRAGKPLELYKGNEVQIVSPGDLVTGMYTWADQVIVATNTTRRRVNNTMREMIHNVDSTEPIVGDKVICLRNYWDTVNETGDCLVNGSIGYLNQVKFEPVYHPFMNTVVLADFINESYEDIDLELSPTDLIFRDLKLDYKLLTEGEPTVNKDNFRKFPPVLRPLEFDYGYAITCWKSQGSEYDKVLLFEESFPFSREDHIKYLYTGATRAAEKLVIIKKA